MPLNSNKILLYGASGFTGKLTIDYINNDESLTWFRSRIVLAGRSAASIEPRATKSGLPWRIFSLDDPNNIDQGLSDIFLVIHMAGPFAITAEPMIKGCIRNQCHYLDITGEPVVYQLIFEKLSKEISQAGILAIPAVGFDVAPTDCVAARLAQALPNATHLDLGICQCPATVTSGTSITILEALTDPNVFFGARVDGQMVKADPGYLTRDVDFPTMGRKYSIFMPWADSYTAYISTKIPTIHMYIPVMWPLNLTIKYLYSGIQLALRIPGVKPTLQSLISKLIKGPSMEQSATGHVDIWAEVRNENTGERVTTTVIVPEAYKFTAYAALEAAKRVVEGRCKVSHGAVTPSMAFGHDYIANIAGVTIGQVIVHSGST